jgi:hypothetical protein
MNVESGRVFARGVFCKGGFSASTLQPKDIIPTINDSLNNNALPCFSKTLPCKKPPLAEKPPSLVYYFTGIVFYFHDVRYEALICLVYLPYVGE